MPSGGEATQAGQVVPGAHAERLPSTWVARSSTSGISPQKQHLGETKMHCSSRSHRGCRPSGGATTFVVQTGPAEPLGAGAGGEANGAGAGACVAVETAGVDAVAFGCGEDDETMGAGSEPCVAGRGAAHPAAASSARARRTRPTRRRLSADADRIDRD